MTDRPNPPSAAELEMAVATWNITTKIGDRVLVRRDNGEVEATRTRSEAYVLSGHTAVIDLEGIRGCFLLSRVKPVGDMKWMASRLSAVFAGVRAWRHKKRNTVHLEIGRGKFQHRDSHLDNEPIVIYVGEDGALYARMVEEFDDGRFIHEDIS